MTSLPLSLDEDLCGKASEVKFLQWGEDDNWSSDLLVPDNVAGTVCVPDVVAVTVSGD